MVALKIRASPAWLVPPRHLPANLTFPDITSIITAQSFSNPSILHCCSFHTLLSSCFTRRSSTALYDFWCHHHERLQFKGITAVIPNKTQTQANKSRLALQPIPPIHPTNLLVGHTTKTPPDLHRTRSSRIALFTSITSPLYPKHKLPRILRLNGLSCRFRPPWLTRRTRTTSFIPSPF